MCFFFQTNFLISSTNFFLGEISSFLVYLLYIRVAYLLSSLDAIRLTSRTKAPDSCAFSTVVRTTTTTTTTAGQGISSCFQRTATARVTAGSTLKATAPLDRFFSLPFPVPL
jgi:hypothetical protein